MNRRHPVEVLVLSLWVSAVATFGVAGCSDNPVGRLCDLGASTPTVDTVVVASPSLDCVSRTCLHYPPNRPPPPGSNPPPINSGLCTAECTADADCDRVPESPCITGFTCGVAVTAGPFCCRKVCICKDYILLPASGQLARPAACDPNDAKNACCNLDRRNNNPDYPLCKS